MRKVFTLLKCIFYFIVGKFFSLIYYEKKYLTGQHFEGRLKGICAKGWRWATYDGINRILFNTNTKVPWPVSNKITVSHPKNIDFNANDLHIFQNFGIYYQAKGAKIVIGEGTWIAPNVGLITANHDVKNLNEHLEGKDIIIGKKSWIGMNTVILPGVILGENTIVGAGSVVTKSFPEGNCVVAGNPAKILKSI